MLIPVVPVVHTVRIEHGDYFEHVFLSKGHGSRVSWPKEEFEHTTDDKGRLGLARVNPGAYKDDLFVSELEWSDIESV